MPFCFVPCALRYGCWAISKSATRGTAMAGIQRTRALPAARCMSAGTENALLAGGTGRGEGQTLQALERCTNTSLASRIFQLRPLRQMMGGQFSFRSGSSRYSPCCCWCGSSDGQDARPMWRHSPLNRNKLPLLARGALPDREAPSLPTRPLKFGFPGACDQEARGTPVRMTPRPPPSLLHREA